MRWATISEKVREWGTAFYISVAPAFFDEVVTAKNHLELDELLCLTTFDQSSLDLSKTALFDTKHARLTERSALLKTLSTIRFPIRLEQDLFTYRPAYVKRLADGSISLWLTKSQFSKQDHIEVAVIETLLVECLALFEVYDLTQIQDCLDHVEVELAEDGMVVMQAKMADVDLDLGVLGSWVFAKLFADLEEALFYLPLDTRLKLLLHVIEL